MRLHENTQLFRQAVEFTAQQMNIPAIFIEKDYWVTYALHTIFHNEIGKETIFKGGTSLSKCFNLIERFSEDIDLVVLRAEGESNNKLTNKIKEIYKVISAVLPEVTIEEVTNKKGMNRKTAHTYAKEFKGSYGMVRDVLIVEASWLGYHEPCIPKPVSSFIYKMMVVTGQESLAIEYGLLPFEVVALEPSRTICEKIMGLVRFSYTDNPIADLKKKIRHIYDLHMLLNKKELAAFFDSSAFDKMLLMVANDDVKSFKNNNDWLIHHPVKAVIFADPDSVWDQLKSAYNGDFKPLVFGSFPDESTVLETLNRIKERLSAIEWTIKLGQFQKTPNRL